MKKIGTNLKIELNEISDFTVGQENLILNLNIVSIISSYNNSNPNELKDTTNSSTSIVLVVLSGVIILDGVRLLLVQCKNNVIKIYFLYRYYDY